MPLLGEGPRLFPGHGAEHRVWPALRDGLLGLLPLHICLAVAPVQRVLFHPRPDFQIRLQLPPPSFQPGQLLLRCGFPAAGAVHLPEGGVQRGQLPFQLGDQAVGPVGPAAVSPVFQGALHGGIGHVLLPGGGQGGDAGLQLPAGADGRPALPHKSGAQVHLLTHPGELLPRIGGGETGDRVAGGGVDGLKSAQGVGSGGETAQGDLPALPLYLGLPGHGRARPGEIAGLIRQKAGLIPLPGVDAVEHGL